MWFRHEDALVTPAKCRPGAPRGGRILSLCHGCGEGVEGAEDRATCVCRGGTTRL